MIQRHKDFGILICGSHIFFHDQSIAQGHERFGRRVAVHQWNHLELEQWSLGLWRLRFTFASWVLKRLSRLMVRYMFCTFTVPETKSTYLGQSYLKIQPRYHVQLIASTWDIWDIATLLFVHVPVVTVAIPAWMRTQIKRAFLSIMTWDIQSTSVALEWVQNTNQFTHDMFNIYYKMHFTSLKQNWFYVLHFSKPSTTVQRAEIWGCSLLCHARHLVGRGPSGPGGPKNCRCKTGHMLVFWFHENSHGEKMSEFLVNLWCSYTKCW